VINILAHAFVSKFHEYWDTNWAQQTDALKTKLHDGCVNRILRTQFAVGPAAGLLNRAKMATVSAAGPG
jgi:hypothetical protein